LLYSANALVNQHIGLEETDDPRVGDLLQHGLHRHIRWARVCHSWV